MTRNNDRLYIALYDRGSGSESYHWALWSAKKGAKGPSHGTLYHATDGAPQRTVWRVESKGPTGTGNTGKGIVRVMVGKIENKHQMTAILAAEPLPRPPNCRLWARNALATLANNPGVIGTSNLDWNTIEQTCWGFAAEVFKKKQFGLDWVATWDMLENKQTVP